MPACVVRGSGVVSRHRPARAARAMSSAGTPMTSMRTLRSLSAAMRVADVGKVEGDARLARVAQRERAHGSAARLASPFVGKTRWPRTVLIEAMRCVTRPAGWPGRAEGDDVAGAQARGRHDAVEDERAAVVGAGHRAAGDDVALEAEQRRHEDGGGEDERGGAQRDAEHAADERERTR